MADSLFDNRYRYDYIYPRGRSGETLRAADTSNGDRPVVIKRPAPNDAPPIRAGQEVSILNERKALKRLAGHPIATEVLGEGQFSVGGMPQQYIVMERAEGTVIADEVLHISRTGERLPTLEMLVILDGLLDLLQAAHDKDVVYNDVDAKHLFWDRENYKLKVIDWGNAVFLEGDEITPQGISHQTDVEQVGQLLYFILTGGRRADIPREAPGDFQLDFGDDKPPQALVQIISKAVHPNKNIRYKTIDKLRRELAAVRQPLEHDRNVLVSHVADRLHRNLSKKDLLSLQDTLAPAVEADPGYPETRAAQQEITDRLRDLSVSADLDAVRIYMESGNWARSAELLNEMRDKAGPKTGGLVELLLDCTVQLLDSKLGHIPSAVLDAIIYIFDGHVVHAAHTLLTQDTPDNEERKLQWLLAERISSRIPEVMLIRPNIYRLNLALDGLAGEGIRVSDAQELLTEIENQLDSETSTNLATLRDNYRGIVDKFAKLNTILTTTSAQHGLSNRKLPLSSLDRATNAAMALADNMHVIGKQATGSPRDATVALDSSKSIDPTNALWDELQELLNSLYHLLQSYQTYVPAADGSDLNVWLNKTLRSLTPFTERLFDEMLVEMVNGVDVAIQAWGEYGESVVLGNRQGALKALTDAMVSVKTLSPTLSSWLGQIRTVIDGATYIERHAISGGYGRAMADGWEAFDRGRVTDAERLAQKAIEISRNEIERFAANRLMQLSSITRDWVDRNGILNGKRTASALESIEALYLEDERETQENFASQMPSRETYLKAMQKGLIEIYAFSSTAVVRIYFMNVILLGAMEVHAGNLKDGGFWRDAALQAMPERGKRHVGVRTLEDFIDRRKNLNSAQKLFDRINGKHALGSLSSDRRSLDENPYSKLLEAGIQSIRHLENALRDWGDGEFRPAGLKIENAIKSAVELEQTANISVSIYRHWLEELQTAVAELHTINRQVRQALDRRSSEPEPIVLEGHRRQAEVTQALLGETYAAQLYVWRDTYESFLRVYTDTTIRRSARLERFNELFKAMFIDRHPAYALYKHWFDVTDASPEFPAPPTDDPTPHMDESDVAETSEYIGERYSDGGGAASPLPRFQLTRRKLILGVLFLIIVIMAIIAVLTSDDDPNIIQGVEVTLVDEETATEQVQVAVTEDVSVTEAPTESGPTPTVDLVTPTLVTPTATDTPSEPSETPPPTETPLPTDTPTETLTYTPSPTDTPTITPSPTNTPTPTLPPAGLQGWQDILALNDRVGDPIWDETVFSSDGTNWRFGIGEATGAEEIGRTTVSIDTDTLNLFYGNEAPSRIRRTDANLSLVTYDAGALETEDVFFGLTLQSIDDPSEQVGIYIQIVSLNILNLWQQQGDELVFVSQRAVNTVNARVRLERDLITGNVTAFFNDAQLGESMPFVGVEAPVQPSLFVTDGGVIVNVLSWRVGLR